MAAGTAVPRYSVSVIIPITGDFEDVEPTVQCAFEMPGVREVILAEAGSGSTAEKLALDYPVRTVQTAPGFARQLQAGADQAKGDVLLFVYPGAQLQTGAMVWIEETLADTSVVGGVFGVRLVDGGKWMRLCHRILSRLGLRTPEAGYFAWRMAFEAANGFRTETVGEDRVFLRHLRKQGRVVHVPAISRVNLASLGEPLYMWLWLALLSRLGVPRETVTYVRRMRGHQHPRRQPTRVGTRPATPSLDLKNSPV